MSRSGRCIAAPHMYLCSLALTVLLAASAAAVPPNLLLDNTPISPMTHANPTIRSFENKVVAVWHDAQTSSSTTEPRIHYAVSTDSGATFTDLGAPPQPNGTGRWRGDPQLTVDPLNGIFYLVGLATTPNVGVWLTRGTFAGNVLTWSTPILVRTSTLAGSLFPGFLALDCPPPANVLHLLHQTGAGVIEYQRSTDGNGAVWSAPVALSSPADAGNVAFPQLAAGNGGVLHAAWSGPRTLGAQPIRVRTSLDAGVSWGTEQTVTTHMNPVMPGQTNPSGTLQVNRPPFSMAVNRNGDSGTFGEVALAWSESWDFSDEPFAPLISTVLRNESEPNSDFNSATPFNVGEALKGTFPDGFDEDYWQVTLAAGDPLLLWGDSTGVLIAMYILAPDGEIHANGYSGGPGSVIAFRAPTAGTYGIKVNSRGLVSPGTPYRIRTRMGTPAPGEGRDAGDIAVARSTVPGGGWTVQHYAFGPMGHLDYMPTIGFADDGLDYVTWYDLSRGSLPGVAQVVVARNLAGNDPVPSPPVTLSSNESSFNDYLIFFPPGAGCANDVYSHFDIGNRLFLAWTDFRNFTADAYAAVLNTDAHATSFPHDTTVTAGTVVTLRARVSNRNSEFDEKVFANVIGGRTWPGALVARDSVPPGSNGIISIPIAVPDTAQGAYPLFIRFDRQSGAPLGGTNVILTIQPNPSGVGDGPAIARLDPVIPNPARGNARIAFTLARAGDARVDVFGLHGERVRTLARGTMAAGPRSLEWNGRDDGGRTMPAGLYFVSLETAGFRAVRPVVIVR